MATVNGTPGDDVLTGTAEHDSIDGLEGDDTISGGGGSDTLYGQAGSDSLWSGQYGSDDSGLEHDQLFGGDGNDTLATGFGDDVDGSAGADSLLIHLGGATSGVILNTSDFASSAGAAVGGGTIRNIESVSDRRFDLCGYDYDRHASRERQGRGGARQRHDHCIWEPGYGRWRTGRRSILQRQRHARMGALQLFHQSADHGRRFCADGRCRPVPRPRQRPRPSP